MFSNRAHNRIKVLYWHRKGFCRWQKRLEKARFGWPGPDPAASVCTLTLKELEWLLEGFDLWVNKPHKALYYHGIT